MTLSIPRLTREVGMHEGSLGQTDHLPINIYCGATTRTNSDWPLTSSSDRRIYGSAFHSFVFFHHQYVSGICCNLSKCINNKNVNKIIRMFENSLPRKGERSRCNYPIQITLLILFLKFRNVLLRFWNSLFGVGI